MADTIAASYVCECGHKTPLTEERTIGAQITCEGCRKLKVIIRSKIEGSLPDAFTQGRRLTASERLDVAAAWDNIKHRRAEKQPTRAELTRAPWIFFLSLLGVVVGGFLTYQNLRSLGKRGRGKRAFVLSILSHIALAGGLVWFRESLDNYQICAAVLGYCLGGAILLTALQSRDLRAGFENNARPQSALVPALIAMILALVEFFAARSFVGGVF